MAGIKRALSNPRSRMVIAWLGQFLLMLWLFFFLGPNTPHGLVTLEMDPDRLIEIFGFSDSGSYLQAAENLIANGRSTPEMAWVLNLWPPGMVWLDAIVLYASPLPVGTTLAIISAFIWSLAFAMLAWPFLRSGRAALVVLVVELAVLSTTPFQSWMIDEWPFYADGFAVAPFLLGLGIIVNRVRVGGARAVWIRDGIFAGLGFALTIYMRASYQLLPWILAGIGVLLAILLVVARRRARATEHLTRQLYFVGGAIVSILLLLLPYAVYTLQSKGRVQFVATEDLVYVHAWEDPEVDEVPQWLQNAGSTLGCDLDQETCDAVHEAIANGEPKSPQELRDLLITAILEHPGPFIAHRVSFVATQWFGDETYSYSYDPGDYETGTVSSTMAPNLNPPQNLLYLGLLIAAAAASIALARRGDWLLLIIPGALIALLAPFAIVHVEVRYLIPLKLMGLLAPALILAWYERRSLGDALPNDAPLRSNAPE